MNPSNNPKNYWKLLAIVTWCLVMVLVVMISIYFSINREEPITIKQPTTDNRVSVKPTELKNVQATGIKQPTPIVGSSEKQFKQDLNQFQQSLDKVGETARAQNDKGGYSAYEESIWQYCHDRWKYYDNLNGGYSGDKYTVQVFKDAATKFKVSPSEAESIWQKVERKKLGN